MLQQKIKDELKIAMKEKQAVKLSVLRNILTAFTNELAAQKRKIQEELSDDDALRIIQRLAKQRKDSIEQYQAGGRADLVEVEEKELVYIKEYLPQMMGKDEIKKIAVAKRDEMGINDPSKKGMLMGALMKELKGKADGGDVKNVVDKLFE